MENRRQFPRLNKKWKMNYSVLNQEHLPKGPLTNYTVNISTGGLCFRTEEPLEPDTMIGIELDAEQFPSLILTLSRVVWCKPVGPEYEVGVEFLWSGWKKNDSRKTIADYIAFASQEEEA